MNQDIAQLIAELNDTVLIEHKQNYDKCYRAARALESLQRQLAEQAAVIEKKNEALRLARFDSLNMTLGQMGQIREALALTASPEILRQRDAETVRKGLSEWENTTAPIYKFMLDYAQRIEKGEQV